MVTVYELMLIGAMVHSKFLKSVGRDFTGTFEVGETTYPPARAPDELLFALKDKYSITPLATVLPLQVSHSGSINIKSRIPRGRLQRMVSWQ